VPQSVGRLPFVERLEAVAQDADASFRHVLLTDHRESAVARLQARTSASDRTEQHATAASMSGGRQGLLDLYDAIHTMAATRSGVVIVPSTEGDIDGTCRRLVDTLRDLG
jgi:hypothetical protein